MRVYFLNIHPNFLPGEKRGLFFTGYYFLGYDDFGTPRIIPPWIFNLITAIFGFVTPEYALYSYIYQWEVEPNYSYQIGVSVVLCVLDSAEGSYKVSSKEQNNCLLYGIK